MEYKYEAVLKMFEYFKIQAQSETLIIEGNTAVKKYNFVRKILDTIGPGDIVNIDFDKEIYQLKENKELTYEELLQEIKNEYKNTGFRFQRNKENQNKTLKEQILDTMGADDVVLIYSTLFSTEPTFEVKKLKQKEILTSTPNGPVFGIDAAEELKKLSQEENGTYVVEWIKTLVASKNNMEFLYENLKKTLQKEMEPFSNEEVILLNLDSTPEEINTRKIYLKRILSQMNEGDKVIFNFDNDIPQYAIINIESDVNLAPLPDDILFVSNTDESKIIKNFYETNTDKILLRDNTSEQLSGEFIRLAKTLEKIYGLQGCFQLYTELGKLIDEELRLEPEATEIIERLIDLKDLPSEGKLNPDIKQIKLSAPIITSSPKETKLNPTELKRFYNRMTDSELSTPIITSSLKGPFFGTKELYQKLEDVIILENQTILTYDDLSSIINKQQNILHVEEQTFEEYIFNQMQPIDKVLIDFDNHTYEIIKSVENMLMDEKHLSENYLTYEIIANDLIEKHGPEGVFYISKILTSLVEKDIYNTEEIKQK